MIDFFKKTSNSYVLPKFSKIVIWGHKLSDPRSSNTFAFIHDSWFKTFKYLGYDVLWLDNWDNISHTAFKNCLFFTEGQVDQKIPILNDCKYVIHNCDITKYKPVLPNVLNLQVYTHDCLSRKVELIDHEQLCYYQPEADFSKQDHGCNNRTLYQPWATNLLPTEFSFENNASTNVQRTKKIFWVGSIMGGPHRNDDKISELVMAAKLDSVNFVHAKLENKLQPQAIATSWISPALQGAWQVEKGYVPCRVFKNLSYGRMTPTNSETVHNLFEHKLVYSPNTEEMYRLGVKWEENPDKETLKWLINKVKEKHTFINRIENILRVI